jgi:hypothetical protein
MALIKLSTGFAQISGKIGGTVFTKQKSGQIMKTNAYSLPQFSIRQSAQQARISLVPSRWQLLTTAEKNDWNTLALDYPYTNKVGDTAYYSGYALFLQFNQNLLNAKIPLELYASSFQAKTGLGTLTITTLTNLVLGINYAGISSQTIMIFGTRGLTQGQQAKDSDFKYFWVDDYSPTPKSWNLTAVYEANVGELVTGLQYWFRFKIVNTSTGVPSEFSTPIWGIAT